MSYRKVDFVVDSKVAYTADLLKHSNDSKLGQPEIDSKMEIKRGRGRPPKNAKKT